MPCDSGRRDHPVDQDWACVWRQLELLHRVFERLQGVTGICIWYCPSFPKNIRQIAIQTLFSELPVSHYSINKAFPLWSDAAIGVFLHWDYICLPLLSVLALHRMDHSNIFFPYSIFCFPIIFSARKQHMSQSAEIQSMTSLSDWNKYSPFRLFPSSHLPLKFF